MKSEPIRIKIVSERSHGLEVVAVYVNDIRATEFLSIHLVSQYLKKHYPGVAVVID